MNQQITIPIGYPLSAICHWPLAIGHRPFAIGHLPFAIGYPPSAIGCLPICYCPLLVNSDVAHDRQQAPAGAQNCGSAWRLDTPDNPKGIADLIRL